MTQTEKRKAMCPSNWTTHLIQSR